MLLARGDALSRIDMGIRSMAGGTYALSEHYNPAGRSGNRRVAAALLIVGILAHVTTSKPLRGQGGPLKRLVPPE